MNRSIWRIGTALMSCMGIFAFVACGGGGGGAGGTPPATVPPVTGLSGTNAISLDSSVPSNTKAAITTFVSGAGSMPASATSINLPAGAIPTQALVFATDQSNNVLLLGYPSQDGSVTLGPASTALVLAMIGLQPLPPGINFTQANAAILASDGYPTLLTAISTALAAGTPPASSSSVLASLGVLVPQAQKTLLPSLSNTVHASNVSVQMRASSGRGAIVHATSPPPLPYIMVPAQPINAITLADNPGNGISLSNNTLIQWAASNTDLNQSTLATASLPRLTVWSSLLSVVTTGALATPTPLAGNGSQFVTVVQQNTKTEIYNLANLLDVVTEAILGNVTGTGITGNEESCLGTAILALMNEDFPKLAASPTEAQLIDYLESFFSKGNIQGTLTAVVACAKPAAAAEAAELAAAEIIGPVIAAVSLTVNGSTAIGITTQLVTWWDQSFQVEICKANGAIVACALQINAPSQFLVVGQSEQMTALVISDGQAFPNPNLLTWASPSSLVSVSATGEVTGLTGAGAAMVTVSDPYQDNAAVSLTVGVPTISPSAPFAGIGGTVQLTLVGPSNQPLPLDPPWEWTSNSPSIASVDPASGLAIGVATGIATIYAQDPTTGATTDLVKFTVNGYATTTTLTPYPTSVPPTGGSVSFTATIASSTAPSSTPAPTGTVKFSDASGVLCAAQPVASGTATCTTSIAAPPDTVTASYSGDSNYAESSGSATVAGLYTTTTTLGANPERLPASGGAVTFTIAISSSGAPAGALPPSGTVTVVDQSGTTLCSGATVTAGATTCSRSIATVPDVITANYSGDANYAPSSGTTTVATNAAVLTISPTAPTVAVGATVTLTVNATDNSGNPIATPPNLTWSSSNDALATVSNGVVAGVAIPQSGAPQPVITVTDPASGASSTVTVTVTGPNWLGTYQGVLCPGTNAVNPDFQFYVQQQAGAAIIVSNSGEYPVYYSTFFLSSNGSVATGYADNGAIIYTLNLNGNVITLEGDTYTTCQDGNTFTYIGPPPPLSGSPIL